MLKKICLCFILIFPKLVSAYEIHPQASLSGSAAFGSASNIGTKNYGVVLEGYVRLNRYLGAGVNYTYYRVDIVGKNWSQLNFFGGVHLFDDSESKLDVYAAAGVGDTFFNSGNDIDVFGRLGFSYRFDDHIGLTANGQFNRIIPITTSNSYNYGSFSMGILYRF